MRWRFLAIGVDDENRGRPLSAVSRAELLILVAILAHVHTHRDETFGDQILDAIVGVHLGIQPSTSASHRCGAEVEEQEFAALACVLKGTVVVVPPGNAFRCCRHVRPLRLTVTQFTGLHKVERTVAGHGPAECCLRERKGCLKGD